MQLNDTSKMLFLCPVLCADFFDSEQKVLIILSRGEGWGLLPIEGVEC